MTCADKAQGEVKTPIANATKVIGIDMGIARFDTFSDGIVLDALNSCNKHEQKLKKYQRRMSRKKKHSKNWKRIRTKQSVKGVNYLQITRYDDLLKAALTLF